MPATCPPSPTCSEGIVLPEAQERRGLLGFREHSWASGLTRNLQQQEERVTRTLGQHTLESFLPAGRLSLLCPWGERQDWVQTAFSCLRRLVHFHPPLTAPASCRAEGGPGYRKLGVRSEATSPQTSLWGKDLFPWGFSPLALSSHRSLNTSRLSVTMTRGVRARSQRDLEGSVQPAGRVAEQGGQSFMSQGTSVCIWPWGTCVWCEGGLLWPYSS